MAGDAFALDKKHVTSVARVLEPPTEEFEDRWSRLVEWINDYYREHRAGQAAVHAVRRQVGTSTPDNGSGDIEARRQFGSPITDDLDAHEVERECIDILDVAGGLWWKISAASACWRADSSVTAAVE